MKHLHISGSNGLPPFMFKFCFMYNFINTPLNEHINYLLFKFLTENQCNLSTLEEIDESFSLIDSVLPETFKYTIEIYLSLLLIVIRSLPPPASSFSESVSLGFSEAIPEYDIYMELPAETK